VPPESMIAVAAPRAGSPFSPKTESIKRPGRDGPGLLAGSPGSRSYAPDVVTGEQPRSAAFCTNTGLGPPGRCSVCFAMAFNSPLHPAPCFGVARAGKAEAATIAAIRAAAARIRRYLSRVTSSL
jgi:hypothetical protein